MSLYSISPLNLQDFCSPEVPFPPVNTSWAQLRGPFIPLTDSKVLSWASNASSFLSWPPLSALRLLPSLQGQSCVEACQAEGFICEPALYRFINIKEAFSAWDTFIFHFHWLVDRKQYYFSLAQLHLNPGSLGYMSNAWFASLVCFLTHLKKLSLSSSCKRYIWLLPNSFMPHLHF